MVQSILFLIVRNRFFLNIHVLIWKKLIRAKQICLRSFGKVLVQLICSSFSSHHFFNIIRNQKKRNRKEIYEKKNVLFWMLKSPDFICKSTLLHTVKCFEQKKVLKKIKNTYIYVWLLKESSSLHFSCQRNVLSQNENEIVDKVNIHFASWKY